MQKALEIHRLLLRHYGEPERKTQRDPLSELIVTILSQNTADVNSHRAYRRLKERFPTWEQARQADEEEVADAIRVGGLANIKAPRIQNILDMLCEERGELSLDFLAAMPLEEARDYLLALPGVGPKTAACVLLFSLHRPALPVDTHVHRVSLRLGLVPAGTRAARAHSLLEEQLPPKLYYPFHLNVIEHGRTLCHARNPLCEECPLQERCLYFSKEEQFAESETD